jgi:hypothetical protein
LDYQRDILRIAAESYGQPHQAGIVRVAAVLTMLPDATRCFRSISNLAMATGQHFICWLFGLLVNKQIMLLN